MNKILKVVAISFGVLITILMFCRITGILNWYKSPTPSNEPNLKTGSYFLASSLPKIKRGDLVTYYDNYIDSVSIDINGGLKKSLYCKRICGVAGDILQMKNGVLFVNNQNFDGNYNLIFNYLVKPDEYQNLNYDFYCKDQTIFPLISISDSFMVSLTSKEFTKLRNTIGIRPFYYLENEDAFKWISKKHHYNIDNFGPFKVPKDCYFVLGDNRHNSLDSRFTGFVKKEDVKSVVIWK